LQKAEELFKKALQLLKISLEELAKLDKLVKFAC